MNTQFPLFVWLFLVSSSLSQEFDGELCLEMGEKTVIDKKFLTTDCLKKENWYFTTAKGVQFDWSIFTDEQLTKLFSTKKEYGLDMLIAGRNLRRINFSYPFTDEPLKDRWLGFVLTNQDIIIENNPHLEEINFAVHIEKFKAEPGDGIILRNNPKLRKFTWNGKKLPFKEVTGNNLLEEETIEKMKKENSYQDDDQNSTSIFQKPGDCVFLSPVSNIVDLFNCKEIKGDLIFSKEASGDVLTPLNVTGRVEAIGTRLTRLNVIHAADGSLVKDNLFLCNKEDKERLQKFVKEYRNNCQSPTRTTPTERDTNTTEQEEESYEGTERGEETTVQQESMTSAADDSRLRLLLPMIVFITQ